MSNLHTQTEHGVTTTIAVFSGCVVLFNDKLSQFFKIPPHITDLEQLHAVFSDEATIEIAAEHYREGFTNKPRFIESARKLFDSRKITEADFAALRRFITTCDCAPSQVRKKLSPMGYGSLPLDFEDKDPRLETTVALLWSYIKNVQADRRQQPARHNSESARTVRAHRHGATGGNPARSES